MKSLIFLTVLIAAAAAASSAHAELIVNGGFEQGYTGWTTSNLEVVPSYSPLSGVVSTVNTPGLIFDPTGSGHGFIKPKLGNDYASLSNDGSRTYNPTGGSAVFSQSIHTDVGKSYVLTFSADILTYVPNATTVRFEADWDNAPLLAILNPATAHQGWVNYSFVVVGTGTDTLTFSGRNDPSYSGLDNVSLNAAVSQTLGADTPLPGNLTMCSVAAVVGLCVYGYRRRIQTAG